MGEFVEIIQDWENGYNQYSEEDRLVSGMDLISFLNSPSGSVG